MARELLTRTGRDDIASLIRGRWVTSTGKLATMSQNDFVELIESYGGRYAMAGQGAGVALLVIGQRSWPITTQGTLPYILRKARAMNRRQEADMTILTEEQFLVGLGLETHRQNVDQFYTMQTLSEVLEMSRERIRAWVRAGLIRPASIEHGVWYFDFRCVSAAKTLCELVRSGVSTARLRKSLEQLRTWLPEAQQPLDQLAVLESDGQFLVRLEEGELAQTDGQLQFDFSERAAPLSLRITPGPRTAAQWYEQGVEQHAGGFLAEAVDSYRQALLSGGPDAHICFDLAHALADLGHKEQAIERYMQAVELDADFADAFNNLGALLAEFDRHEEAALAFRRALTADPQDFRAHYNLADTLQELGRQKEAAAHWKAYLVHDSHSQWAHHARRQLTAG